ncbi:hypothetical protein DW223_01510 [Butyricicoccus sp. AM18-35]|nr:hypothetical protein [Butyricicoccus sp. AM18-35]RHO18199.1 hypothetical protein DW223_01510 [Butyricicoccus sp. AM18-35]
MTAVLSGLTQPIEQESLLHRKPTSRTTVRVPTGTRQSYPQGQNGQSGFLKATPDYMEAGKASILCSCEPAAAMVFGFFLFEEIPAVLSITDLIIVLIAPTMLVLSDKKPEIVEEYNHVKR